MASVAHPGGPVQSLFTLDRRSPLCDPGAVSGQPLHVDDASWAFRQPGIVRRWSGVIALASLLVGSLLRGTNGARLAPRTFSTPHPAASVAIPVLLVGFLSLLVYLLVLSQPPERPTTNRVGAVHVEGGHLTLAGEGNEGLLPSIHEAMGASGKGADRIQLDRLDRRGRPLQAWIEDLEAITGPQAGLYRAGAVLPEQLATVVEDPAVAPHRRVAAAVSVAASGDEAARARVRIAAQASADDELRAALEQAALGEVPEVALRRMTRS